YTGLSLFPFFLTGPGKTAGWWLPGVSFLEFRLMTEQADPWRSVSYESLALSARVCLRVFQRRFPRGTQHAFSTPYRSTHRLAPIDRYGGREFSCNSIGNAPSAIFDSNPVTSQCAVHSWASVTNPISTGCISGLSRGTMRSNMACLALILVSLLAASSVAETPTSVATRRGEHRGP